MEQVGSPLWTESVHVDKEPLGGWFIVKRIELIELDCLTILCQETGVDYSRKT